MVEVRRGRLGMRIVLRARARIRDVTGDQIRCGIELLIIERYGQLVIDIAHCGRDAK